MRRFFTTMVMLLLTSNAFAARSGGGGTKPHSRDSEYSSSRFSSSDVYNLRFAPISLLVGTLSAELDIAMTPDWTVGPSLQYARTSFSSGLGTKYEVTATSIGARANWFKNGVYTDGLYLGPSVGYYSAKAAATNLTASATAEASGLVLGGLVGYGWFWESFNQMLGVGLIVGLGDMKMKAQDSNGTYSEVSSSIGGLDIEYTLGWKF